jgi:hypothetical protein
MAEGYEATVRIAVESELQDATDDEIDADLEKIFRSAKVIAALHTKFGAPTRPSATH